MRSKDLDLMTLMGPLQFEIFHELQFLCNIGLLFRIQIVLFVAVLLKTQDFLWVKCFLINSNR